MHDTAHWGGKLRRYVQAIAPMNARHRPFFSSLSLIAAPLLLPDLFTYPPHSGAQAGYWQLFVGSYANSKLMVQKTHLTCPLERGAGMTGEASKPSECTQFDFTMSALTFNTSFLLKTQLYSYRP